MKDLAFNASPNMWKVEFHRVSTSYSINLLDKFGRLQVSLHDCLRCGLRWIQRFKVRSFASGSIAWNWNDWCYPISRLLQIEAASSVLPNFRASRICFTMRLAIWAKHLIYLSKPQNKKFVPNAYCRLSHTCNTIRSLLLALSPVIESSLRTLICIGLFWVTGFDLFGLQVGLTLSSTLRTNSSSVLDHDQAYGTRVHASIERKRIHSHDDTSWAVTG